MLDDCTLLLVEDDPSLASLQQEILERSGFNVEHALDGRKALEALIRNDIDLVVLDYRLPDMTGLDLLSVLGKRLRSLPVLMVTGYASPDLEREALQAGAHEFLVKDIDLRFLDRLPGAAREALVRHKTLESEPAAGVHAAAASAVG